MSTIRFGSEVYTWFMQETGKAYENKLDHMIRVASEAGFSGIEPMHFWMGDLADPIRLRDCLAQNNMQLAGIALVLEWNGPEEKEDERNAADNTIAFLKGFPGAKLCTVQLPTNRDNLVQRRLNLVANVNTVSRRAKAAGVRASFHPNSPHSSINRTAEDYEVIINGLDPDVSGWTPDVGHIANGGMDPLDTMKKWAHLVDHVHYKDWDGNPEWALMGEGKIDFVGITRWLVEQNYQGWIICEDEADAAVQDPDGVTRHDGKWTREHLMPLVG